MFRKPSVLCAVLAAIALSVGLLDYLFGRQPGHVYFLFHGFSLAYGHRSAFGVLGNNLPSFVHVYALILFTVAVAGFSKPRLIGTCVAWFVIASLFEIAQHPVISPVVAAAVPAWFTHIPVLDNTAAYFLNGTFDLLDLLSIALGTIAAYATILRLKNRVSVPTSNKPPHSVLRYLSLGGIALFGMLAIIGSGDGTSGTGTTVPGAGSQLYVSGNGSSTLLIYNDANTVSGTTAANRIVSGGLTTLSVPRGIAIDMPRNQLYVANTGANSILVFNDARTVTGGDAPSRTIGNTTTPITPTAMFIDSVNDRLYVTSGNSVLIYDNADTLNGSAVTPNRTLVGVLTTLISPTGIYVDTTRNLLYVANGTNQILVFNNADSVNGNIAPVRTIPISSASAGILVDVMADRLYVANTSANSIFVFDGASTANSSSSPDRTLSGGTSALSQPRSVFVDTGTDELYVTNAGNDSVLVFSGASTVTNPATPGRTLTLSASTGPWGIFVDVTPVIIGSTASLDGYARSDSFASATGSPATGDEESNASLIGVGWRQLYSFDISSIPMSATITAAILHLYQCKVAGSPYGSVGPSLGNVIADHVNYGGTIDPSGSAYNGGLVLNIGTLSTTASPGYRSLSVTTSVQDDLTASRMRSQYRLRFSNFDANSNGNDDFAQFTDAEDSPCVSPTTNQPPQLAVTLRP